MCVLSACEELKEAGKAVKEGERFWREKGDTWPLRIRGVEGRGGRAVMYLFGLLHGLLGRAVLLQNCGL